MYNLYVYTVYSREAERTYTIYNDDEDDTICLIKS